MKQEMARMLRREEAIVSRLDLDEIDLVTERLKFFSGKDSSIHSKHSSKVP